MERLEIQLVGDTDLGVSSPVEENESRGRDASSAATPSAEGESEPLDPLDVNLVSEVPLSILSSRLRGLRGDGAPGG